MLLENRGLSFDFILGNLPRANYDIFVDASTEWGIGGCCGNLFFKFSWSELTKLQMDAIARNELLAALIALHCFRHVVEDRIVVLYTDNTNVRDWLVAGRSSKLKGLKYLALWELVKFRARCKVSPRWLPGSHNISADRLSRGVTPAWLRSNGRRQFCNLQKLILSWRRIEESWDI